MKTLGGYSLLGTISSGGMGHVFLAEKATSLGFRKRFALKTMRRSLVGSEDSVAAFIDEARLVAQLEHRNIAQVYDFGFDGEVPYLVMEYVHGTSLQRLVESRGPLPRRAAMQIMRDAAAGLHAAHTARSLETGEPLGVVHRDVSLSNIMLSARGEVKVVDFGIALAQDRMTPATLTGTVKGKPSYMSPEQLQGELVDARTDVFALWVVFVEMLLGRPLFARKTIYDTTRAVMEAPLPRIADIDPELPEPLDPLLQLGLHRSREARMADAAEIVQAMERLLPATNDAGIDTLVVDIAELVPTLEPSTELRVLVDEGQTVAMASPSPSPDRRRLGWITAPVLVVLAVVFVFLAVRGKFLEAKPAAAPIAPEASDELLEPAAAAEKPAERAAAEPEPTRVNAQEKREALVATVERTRPPRARKSRVQKRPAAPAPPPASDPAVEKRPQGFGALTVFADPFARVRVDGTGIGVTPILNHRVSAGEHTVELLDPDSGAVRVKRVVRVAPDASVRVTDR